MILAASLSVGMNATSHAISLLLIRCWYGLMGRGVGLGRLRVTRLIEPGQEVRIFRRPDGDQRPFFLEQGSERVMPRLRDIFQVFLAGVHDPGAIQMRVFYLVVVEPDVAGATGVCAFGDDAGKNRMHRFAPHKQVLARLQIDRGHEHVRVTFQEGSVHRWLLLASGFSPIAARNGE